jgi:hypothetical protein
VFFFSTLFSVYSFYSEISVVVIRPCFVILIIAKLCDVVLLGSLEHGQLFCNLTMKFTCVIHKKYKVRGHVA